MTFPGEIACIIFTRGCNYTCSYCQNSSLIRYLNEKGRYEEDEILDFLNLRKNKLGGIVISGGEPTIQSGLIEFIKKVKKIGYKVKLDTNGSNPKVLKELLDNKLLDYVAMDIKNDLDHYEDVVKSKVNIKNIKESINLLINSNIEYEFRTTIIKEYHTLDSIKNILKLIKNSKYYIQNFRLSDDVIDKSLTSFTEDELKFIKKELQDMPNVILRDL